MDSSHSHLAKQFAKELSLALQTDEFIFQLHSARPQEEHKHIAPLIIDFLNNFLQRHDIDVKEDTILFDWEGNNERTGPQTHSYPLLGTYAHPDAAVLKPFKCAVEIDRESPKSFSFFKEALMKASVHVLSGAYESTIFVYMLRVRPLGTYRNDQSEYTAQLLRLLESHGLYTCIIPSA